MLKYLFVQELFREIPGEITLGISISGCQIHCKGCHSRDLWENKGEELDVEALCGLLNLHPGISCVCFFGGEHDLDNLTKLFMYAHQRIKTAWYCGLDRLPKDKRGILDYLDYVKFGHFDMELGGLDSPTTNQRLYQYSHLFSSVIPELGAGWRDITYQLQKNNKTNDY